MGIFVCGIQNTGKFCLWNSESLVLESGIALMIGIQNPTCTDKYWNPVPGLVLTAWNPESKTVLDFLTCGD